MCSDDAILMVKLVSLIFYIAFCFFHIIRYNFNLTCIYNGCHLKFEFGYCIISGIASLSFCSINYLCLNLYSEERVNWVNPTHEASITPPPKKRKNQSALEVIEATSFYLWVSFSIKHCIMLIPLRTSKK